MTPEQIIEVRKTLAKATEKQDAARTKAIAEGSSHREHYHSGVARGLHHALMLLGGPVAPPADHWIERGKIVGILRHSGECDSSFMCRVSMAEEAASRIV
jgi:hypothetical protein